MNDLEKFEEALKIFSKALEENDKDDVSYTGAGLSNLQLNKIDEADIFFKKALEINPSNYAAKCLEGVIFSQSKKYKEAIDCFKEAQAINNKDPNILRQWSVAAFNSGDFDTAFEKISEACSIDPHNKSFLEDLKYVCTYLKKDINEVFSCGSSLTEPGVTELRALIERVRAKFGPRIDEFILKEKKTEERLGHFLEPTSDFKPKITVFLALRKWNSYTPAIPSDEEDRSIGGGYFIYRNGRGTVIDPGYNFIENFSNAGGKIVDIDNVIITHAHNDHTNDFESLLTLIHEFNEHNSLQKADLGYKKITVYVNTGALIKFACVLDLKGTSLIAKLFTLNPGNTYNLDNDKEFVMTVLPAYHNELVTKDHAIGLHFSFGKDARKRTILLTSDTGLFPQKDGGKANTEGDEIFRLYGDCAKEVDLLIPHLGSIKEMEIKASLDTKKEDVFYANHLGILGTARIITYIHPKIALVSEFGEELRDFRDDLVKMLQEVVTEFFEKNKENIPLVLPADIPFIYDVINETIFCALSEEVVPYRDILAYLHNKQTFYFFKKEAYSKLDSYKIEGFINSFESKRKVGICSPYLRGI